MKQKWPFLLASMLFLIGIVGSILLLQRTDTDIIEIVQDVEVRYQLDLQKTENQIVEVEYEGRVNRIEIQDHQIHMLEADCPDHTCVNMGWLDSATPIVCLPNHLVIQFSGKTDEVDGRAG